MSLTKRSFGRTKNGKEATLYILENSKGMRAEVTDFGAVLVNLYVPDENGRPADLVLGFENVSGYEKNGSCFGATIGPNANRIAGAKFTIDGVEYKLDVNDGPNNLHSHLENGYHKKLWDVVEGSDSVTFTVRDTDGYMGFPGNKELSLTYTLDEENGLTLRYHGKSDKKTVLNPTNHSYFNLDGAGSGDIESHVMQINASYYTPVVAGAIPTGELAPVAGTPMDFTNPKPVGRDIRADFEQLKLTQGYDHNWAVDGWDGTLRLIATVSSEKSGRRMEVYSTLPGVQFYAGNCIGEEMGKNGVLYGKRSGLCLETQYFPNSVNTPNFPSCVFGGEREYDAVTVYRFV